MTTKKRAAKKPDPFKAPREFAKAVKAKIAVPSDPSRPYVPLTTTAPDIAATWARFGFVPPSQKKAQAEAEAAKPQQLRRAK
jgi:hypothetical protein